MKVKLLLLILSIHLLKAQTILLFVSHEETYFSEYVVMVKALEASGYNVEVRSASNMDASTYMLPNGTDIQATANSLAGSSYTEFTTRYAEMFNSSWNSSWNATPSTIAVDGRIQDVVNMNSYAAFVIAGGTGALSYRVDGSYSSQGSGGRMISASEIQAVSEKLNSLAIDALNRGIPVLAQCHAASLPVYWRIPSTSGPGNEALGYSLLKGQMSAGYPETQTTTDYNSLDVLHMSEDRVRISSPHSSFNNSDANSKIITSRDWYPQTVAHAARTLINTLETFPSSSMQKASTSVLVLHGGAINTGNCNASNRSNDVPCNYGGGSELPADYTNVVSLLNENSSNDEFQFQVTQLNLSGTLPFSLTDENAIYNYLLNYQVVIFYKHWSTNVTSQLQNALVNYVDASGGLIALHHGLYNDIDGSLNKNILVNTLFKAESAMNTWSANRTNYQLYTTNYGHFITTFGVNFSNNATTAPNSWNTNALLIGSNISGSTYHNFSIYDELYNNMSFLNGQSFGYGTNEITPLLSNNQSPSAQCHTSGFARRYNSNLDNLEGRLVYMIAGERPEIFVSTHIYGQMVRNAVSWAAQPMLLTLSAQDKNFSIGSLSPNPNNGISTLRLKYPTSGEFTIFDHNGTNISTHVITNSQSEYLIDLSGIPSGLYYLRVNTGYNTECFKLLKQ